MKTMQQSAKSPKQHENHKTATKTAWKPCNCQQNFMKAMQQWTKWYENHSNCRSKQLTTMELLAKQHETYVTLSKTKDNHATVNKTIWKPYNSQQNRSDKPRTVHDPGPLVPDHKASQPLPAPWHTLRPPTKHLTKHLTKYLAKYLTKYLTKYVTNMLYKTTAGIIH